MIKTMSSRTRAQEVVASPEANRLLRQVSPELADDPEKFAGALLLPIGVLLGYLGVAVTGDFWERLGAIPRRRRDQEPALAPDLSFEPESVPRASAELVLPGASEVNATLEVEVRGPDHGNPYVDVDLRGILSCGGDEITMGGFYDGDGRYLIRFLPPHAGTWELRVESTARSIDGLTGRLEVVESAHPGPVRVAERFHFAYENGKNFRPMGTTLYAWTHQPDALAQATLRTLEDSPFNKVRMCVFPKAFVYNDNEPEVHAFEKGAGGWDTTRFVPEFFRRFEQRVRDLDRLGIQADVILFHPYDRWGYEDLGAAADDRYLRYVVRRLAGIPNVWWSLANEYDFMTTKDPEDWERYARIVAEEDPVGHLLSVHNGAELYDYAVGWATHASIQRGTVEQVRQWRELWQKPVVIDEPGYEGNLEHDWGNLTGQELVRRAWETMTLGGYFTHGETFWDPDDVVWWSKGGVLRGEAPARLEFLDRVVAQSPTGRLDPITTMPPTPAGGVRGEYEIYYNGSRQPHLRTIEIPAGREAAVDVLDTWAMTIETRPDPVRGRVTLEMPTRPWMALRLRMRDIES
jgi:hypothetical protein